MKIVLSIPSDQYKQFYLKTTSYIQKALDIEYNEIAPKPSINVPIGIHVFPYNFRIVQPICMKFSVSTGCTIKICWWY